MTRPGVIWACSHCDVRFQASDELRQHVATAHQAPPALAGAAGATNRRHALMARPSVIWACSHCDVRFQASDELRQHVATAHQAPPALAGAAGATDRMEAKGPLQETEAPPRDDDAREEHDAHPSLVKSTHASPKMNEKVHLRDRPISLDVHPRRTPVCAARGPPRAARTQCFIRPSGRRNFDVRFMTHRSIPTAVLIVLVGAALTVSWFATGAWTTSAFAGPNASTVLTGKLSASSSAAGHPAAAMGDRKQQTVWRALNPALPQWVMLDLGSRHQVTSSTVSWIVPGQVGFSIYGSTNGVSWSRLANERWNRKSTTNDAITGAWRYLRLQIGVRFCWHPRYRRMARHRVHQGDPCRCECIDAGDPWAAWWLFLGFVLRL